MLSKARIFNNCLCLLFSFCLFPNVGAVVYDSVQKFEYVEIHATIIPKAGNQVKEYDLALHHRGDDPESIKLVRTDVPQEFRFYLNKKRLKNYQLDFLLHDETVVEANPQDLSIKLNSFETDLTVENRTFRIKLKRSFNQENTTDLVRESLEAFMYDSRESNDVNCARYNYFISLRKMSFLKKFIRSKIKQFQRNLRSCGDDWDDTID